MKISSTAIVNIVVLAIVSLFAGVIGFVPDNEPQIVNATGGAGGGELLLEDDQSDTGGGGGQSLVGGSAGSEGSAAQVVEGGSETGTGGGGETGASGPVECAAGKNGGDTDVGVSGNRIGLASTIVTTGPGSTFLKQSQFGMQAVVAKVNSAGGICGRGLDLKLVNDNWEAQRGHNELRNFLNDDGIFALPVVPSSEGLAAADQDIEKHGKPVVGSDGMRRQQYTNSWIWPVALPTVSQVRILAQHAADNGADTFAIVWDNFYKFGVEGKDAFKEFVETTLKKDFVHDEGIQPNQPGYNTQIKNLNDACEDNENGCDAVLMLADPGTANTWIQGDGNWTSRAEFRMGAQPLFTDDFGQDCGLRCDGMLVISGYRPPLESNAGLPGIKEYVQDVKAVQPSADVSNQFLEGAYLGMQVFVEALEQVGPNLTRTGVQSVLNGDFSFESDLAKELSWNAEQRKANIHGQIWQIKAGSGSFDGFRFLEDFQPDPLPDKI